MSLRTELIQVAAVAVATVTDYDQGNTNITSGEHGSRYDDDVLMSIIYDILDERERQEAKWGTRHIHSAEWLMILAEEVGESVDEIQLVPSDHRDPEVIKAVFRHLSIAGEMARAWLEAGEATERGNP